MKCLKCDHDALFSKTMRRHVITVGGARFVGELAGEQCGHCKANQFMLSDLVKLEGEAARHLAERGPVNGATMRYMRTRVPLTAVALAELLHVAPETVSRWETGERDVDRAAWLVVRSLLLNPKAREEIGALRDAPSARAVPIAV